LSSVSSKSRPKVLGRIPQDVADEVVVDQRQRERPDDDAPDGAEPAEDHHGQDEDGERELELVRVHGVQEGRLEGTRDAADRGAHGVGHELRLDERHAHGRGRDLVLAQGDPRPSEPRVAQADDAEQDDERQGEHEPVPRAQVELRELLDARDLHEVHRGDALAAGVSR
jgi:hypothetical protein